MDVEQDSYTLGLSQDVYNSAPLRLLINAHPPCCAHEFCGRPFDTQPKPFRLFGLEILDEDGDENPRRLLVLLCSEQCQQDEVENCRFKGWEVNPWTPERVDDALKHPEKFAGLFDLSPENVESTVRVLEAGLSALLSGRGGLV